MGFFKRLFSKKEEPIPSPSKEISLSDIKQFDDVWIKINDYVCEGWVVSVKNGIINIVYTDKITKRLEDIIFKIERPLNRNKLEQNNKVLYLTKEAACE